MITGTESLGHAFKNIANQIIGDIVQMTVKMLIFKALTSVFGGGGLGSSIFPVSGGIDPLAPLGARASGGPVMGGQTYIVGEKGPELLTPGTSGAITPNSQLVTYPNRGPANNNTPQRIELTIVTEPSDDAWAKVSNISASQIGQAAPLIITQAGKSTMRALGRPRITGGR